MAGDPSSPMYRSKQYPTQPRLNIPVYHKDVNADWTRNNKGLILYNSDATKSKIINVLEVMIGEEHHEPTAGSRWPYRLFEPVSDKTAYLLETDTIAAVRAQMRDEVTILANQCRVTPIYGDGEGYSVDLAYQPIMGGPVEYLHHSFRKASPGYS